MTGTRRPAAEASIGSEARRLAAEVTRQEARRDRAAEAADEARRQLQHIQDELRTRFGRPIPFNPRLFDVLQLIEIRSGDYWHWRGLRNNNNLATVRGADDSPRAERSAVRYLAVAFGLIGEDDHGALYPTGDAADVNPWHRSLRRAAKPTGNWHRFEEAS